MSNDIVGSDTVGSKIVSGDTASSEKIYNWSDIRRDIDDYTPKEIDFDDAYRKDQINSDLTRVANIKARLGIKPEKGISDSKVQEYATAQEIGEMDWFHEGKRAGELFPDDKGQQTTVFLASEFDDLVNHIDAVCMMKNADSDFLPIPFALDITYNTNDEDLDKKFGWRHPQLGITGFATVKYFEDTFSMKPQIAKGRIGVLPRFVIGFSPELSNEITELRMMSGGWESLRREELTTKAKWCVLRELKAQSEQMLKYLERHKSENLFSELYQNVQAIDGFVGGAIEAAAEADKEHPDWISYPDRDQVFNAISIRKLI